MNVTKVLVDRFTEKVDKSGNCWVWTGATRDGYGQIRVEGRTRMATHVAWLLEHKELPTLHVCHTCDNPPCVNPAHLFQGTDVDNHRDKAEKERNGRSLTADQVREIRALAGTLSHRKLGARFGVTHVAIGKVIRRQTWTRI